MPERPLSIDHDWNRLYSEFPEVYDEWVAHPHDPSLIDAMREHIALDGKDVVDVGAGTGRSSIDLARQAAHVIAVEPNPGMRAVAEQRVAASGFNNIDVVDGAAQTLPVSDASVDAVVGVTTVMWPAELVVPAFVEEARRVLRCGGSVAYLSSPPGSYGGHLGHVIDHETGPEQEAQFRVLTAAGYHHVDLESVQDFGDVETAVRTYGFIFGRRVIDHLRETGEHAIRWRWRLWLWTKT